MTLNIADRHVVSRKQRWCYWCPEPIAPGDRYRRVVGVFEGDFYSSAFHPECFDACMDSSDPYSGEWCTDRNHGRGGLCEE